VRPAADIIIGKLKAWAEGRSAKHPADIFNMLVFSLSGFGDQQIDLDHVSVGAARSGPETLALWNELVARAESEVRKFRED
jgi:hypothetical protein